MRIKTVNLIWLVAGTIPLVLATSGCATRRYVSRKIEPVNNRIGQVEAQTNEKIAAVSTKHDSDMSQVNEHLATTDMKVAQNTAAVQQIQGVAARALEQAGLNADAIRANMANSNAGMEGTLNYQLVDKADVTFALNRATLTKDTKSTLDQLAQKARTMPNAVVEIAGFTDKTGGPNYNLVLSRRRAEAVERYLALQSVPVRSIHAVALGEEPPPAELAMDYSGSLSKADIDRLSRRVRVRIFDGGKVEGSASRSK